MSGQHCLNYDVKRDTVYCYPRNVDRCCTWSEVAWCCRWNLSAFFKICFGLICYVTNQVKSVLNIVLLCIIIWLALRAGKMNQIARCDWLPERARWSHLARSGLPAISRKQNFTKSHIINTLLAKFVRSRWLDIGLVLFLRVYGPRLRLGP